MPNHRKPKAIAILDGTRKSRIPKDEPKSPIGIGPAPDWLGIDGAMIWNRISAEAPKDLLTKADALVVEILAETWSLWLACQRSIRDEGLVLTTITDRGEQNKPHPLLATANQTAKQIASMLNSLGMTPGGRATIGIEGDKKPDALMAFITSGGRITPDRKPEPVYAKPKAKPAEPRTDRPADFGGAPKRAGTLANTDDAS